jgi:hypothetical protein
MDIAMNRELEYRDLLRKAQTSADSILEFLMTIDQAARTQGRSSVNDLVRVATSHAKSLEHEIDQIWDEFKRT